MKNSFENFSPQEEEIQKKRDAYEEQVGKDAKKVNTFFENITKTGMTKEDVIREDAMDEDCARGYRDDYRLVDKEDLEEIVESALTLSKKNDKGKSILEGIIDGKKVKILFDGVNNFEGSFDGKTITEQEAKEIYNKYAKVAKDRLTSIQITHDVEAKPFNKSIDTKSLKAIDPENYKAIS